MFWLFFFFLDAPYADRVRGLLPCILPPPDVLRVISFEIVVEVFFFGVALVVSRCSTTDGGAGNPDL